jgi:hypothetical protein
MISGKNTGANFAVFLLILLGINPILLNQLCTFHKLWLYTSP